MPVIKKNEVWGKTSLQLMEWEDFFPAAVLPEEKNGGVIREKPAPRVPAEEKTVTEEIQPSRVVEEARDQARQIVEQAQVQSQQIKDDAYRRGLEQAVVEAEKKAEDKYQVLFRDEAKKITQLVEAIETSYSDIVRKAENSLVKLALDVAKKIVRQECSSQEKIVTNMVKEGLSRIGDKVEVRVRVNPAQLPVIKKYRDSLQSEIEGIKEFEVIADSGVTPGGCVIETESGSLDLRIEKQFSEIKENLTGEGSDEDEEL